MGIGEGRIVLFVERFLLLKNLDALFCELATFLG
jgi:hypothetical protein